MHLSLPAKTTRTGVDAVVKQEIAKWETTANGVKIIKSRPLSTSLPGRDFRGAWEDDGSNVVVNMPRAKVIQMDRIRDARKPEFARLDGEWMKAMGQGNHSLADKTEAERQVLRDLPQTFDLARPTTPEALKALWPKELPVR